MTEIIDLFAGPGGLGEGFSSFTHDNERPFKIKISIEKESFAYKTLSLRAFYRQFKTVPKEYYQYVRGEISIDDLFSKYPEQAACIKNEVHQIELGSEDFPHNEVMKKINQQVVNPKNSIIIGGPPCQAYSLAGRAKMAKNENFESDPRHTLYLEYLKIIADVNPAVFVMENVKGILSSKLNGEYIFDKILNDIKIPSKVKKPTKKRFNKNETYSIYSLTIDKDPSELKREDFIIKSEEYGISQCRHRVILLGIRNDINIKPNTLEKQAKIISCKDVISDLPKIRSGLSKGEDTLKIWREKILSKFPTAKIGNNLSRGSEFLKYNTARTPKIYKEWFFDEKLNGVLNHVSKSHMDSDLHRYYYMSSLAKKNNISPKLHDLPTELLPKHKNVMSAVKSKSLFNDRFKVQIADKPATTITSHIAKDGHYFIHYDPSQCRSLTVREAARIQTFPDNYKFEGPKTSQYQQVGNAVPPLLAYQIAKVVYDILREL